MQPFRFQLRVLTTQKAAHRQVEMKTTIDACKSLAESDWKFFFAIPHDSANLLYDDLKALETKGRTLSPAELSCYASHFEIVRAFVEESDADYLLVMEDDIYIDPNFNFRDVFPLMAAGGIDYLRLYARMLMTANLVLYSGRFQISHFPWSPGGTQAYVLSRAGAVKLATHIARARYIYRPIDDEMDRSWEVGNAVYALHPWPVMEYNAQTTIHDKDQLNLRVQAEADARAQAKPQGLAQRLRKRLDAQVEKVRRKRFDREVVSNFAKTREGLQTFARSGAFTKFRYRD